MAKNYYTYTTDEGVAFSFLQDDTIAAAMSNGVAGALQPVLRGSRAAFRPRKTWVKLASGKYAGYVNGNVDFAGISQGDTVLGGVVVGKVGEKHYAEKKGI